jgi:hypothetical protein
MLRSERARRWWVRLIRAPVMRSLTDEIAALRITIAQKDARIAVLERERTDFFLKFSKARSELATLRAKQHGEYA